MDLFPIVLTNRDMNTLMRLLEKHDGFALEAGLDAGIVEEYNLEGLKSAVSQMSGRQMSRFLKEFGERLREEYIAFPFRFSPGEFGPQWEESVEGARDARADSAIIYSLRQRVRSPRGQ